MSFQHFHERWLIRFTLTTTSPLHLGDGRVETKSKPRFRDEDTAPEYDTIFTDHDHKPAIPGASLKGVLRPRLAAIDTAACERLLGCEDTSHHQNHKAGGLSLFDGRAGAFTPPVKPPRWDPARLTGIAVSVSLDRVTRTADEGRLFHYEYVPPGLPFTFEIGGERIEDHDISALIQTLHAFNDAVRPLRLGAHTSSGWGAMHFDPATLHVWKLDTAGVKRWLAAGAKESGWDIVEKHGTLVAKEEWAEPVGLSTQADFLHIPLTVRFAGAFLVNDPTQCMPKKARANQRAADEARRRPEKPNHAPRLNPDGSIDLPARSVRGALSSRVERILRTLGIECAAPGTPVRAIQRVADLIRADGAPLLDPARRLFGSGGWRGALEVGQFTQTGETQILASTSVAIDRFTQAAADRKLFTTRAAWQPVFTGSISVDLAHLRRAGDPAACLHALAWALRDWMDGDLAIGFGASKGFGASCAEISSADFQLLLNQLSPVAQP